MKITILVFIFFISSYCQAQKENDTALVKVVLSNIRNKDFTVADRFNSLPRFIKKTLRNSEKFSTADKGKRFNATDDIDNRCLPNKRIVYIAIYNDLIVVSFEKGGLGKSYISMFLEHSKEVVTKIIKISLPYHENILELEDLLTKNLFYSVDLKHFDR